MRIPSFFSPAFLLVCILFTSCENPESAKLKDRELALQKKEAALDQKELVIKEQRPAAGNANSATVNEASVIPALLAKGNFNLPTTSGELIASLGPPTEFELEDFERHPSGWGNRYIWKLPNGLVITAQSDSDEKESSDKDGVRAVFLETSNKSPINRLVYGLALNKTTKEECQQLFGSSFKPSVYGKGLDYKVSRDHIFTFLVFNTEGVLTEIKQTTIDLDTI